MARAQLGIPYARAARWGAPERVDGVAVGHVGPPAPQPLRPISKFAHGEAPPGVEDCLSLNVWVPDGDGPFPVFVWSIGGGWTVGWAGSSIYDGAALADALGAVVVTFTYRLGSLGWLYLDGGNFGLLDHVAVLEWVRDHVADFGGDPARVTMAGQSAGAANVAGLLCSPLADGLFARAVLHSPPLPEAGNDPVRGARWRDDLLARVASDAPADAIVAAHEALLGEEEWAGTRGAAWPTVDAATLPVAPLDAPTARLDVPVLIGNAADEATFLFRAGRPPAAEDDSERVRTVTEKLFHAPARAWADAREAAGGSVWRFRVEHSSPDPRLGALHTIDVPLLFGTFATSDVARHFVADDEATRLVSADMQARWRAFVAGGSPGWESSETYLL